MKNIKNYSIRRNVKKYIFMKTVFFTLILFFLTIFFNMSSQKLLTDILINWKISQSELYKKATQLTFNWTIWPVKQITDLSYKSLERDWLTYKKLRWRTWNNVPKDLKVNFPKKVSSYIKKYQNITLKTAWNVFSNPEELNKFTFMRRIIRTIWTADYDSKLIWKKWTWTHAWVDIIWNVWTPVYSIANWLVIEIKHSQKYFWNFIWILYKVNGKYYMWLYWHLHSISSNIKVGDFVDKWTLIWEIWKSWNAFWAHLHFQINKVFTLQDIVNNKAMIWRYHNLAWVIAYTVDPINFVEKYYKPLNNFHYSAKEWNLDNLLSSPVVIKTYKFNKVIKNWFYPWYCTRFVAVQKFPYISKNLQSHPWLWNANEWYQNAQKAGYNVWKQPKVWAIIVYTGSAYSKYWHVWIVEQVKTNSLIVKWMNLAWKYIVSEREIPINNNIYGYIYYYPNKRQSLEWDNFISLNKKNKIVNKKHKIVNKKQAYIKYINLWLIDNKIQLWHWFTIKLVVYTWDWQISIIPSNSNLSFGSSIIQNPDKSSYNINVLATKLWITKLKISDGKSVREYVVNIYKNNYNNVFWIKWEVSWLNLLSSSKLTIYPINRYWKIINNKLNWLFKIYVEKNWQRKLINTLQINWNKWFLYIRWDFIWTWKLIIKSSKYYLVKNIITNISKDYKYNWKYAKDLYVLIKSNIIKWQDGKIFPYQNITRNALVAILWRSVLKVNYKKAKIQMLTYLKTKWRFFKDINGTSYFDPYIFVAWKKWILHWDKWYSLANQYVSKAWLLTIYTRLFKIPTKENNLNVWNDLKENNPLKAIWDTCKKYWLYPFKSYTNFNAWEHITRLIAFETLKRFMDISSVYNSFSNTQSMSKNSNKTLENTMSSIFNF